MPRRLAKARARGAVRSGRPSKADAERLRERILSAATELFLAEGYGSTSIEAVAARARISKRTLYDRFEDKAALFAAAVHGVIAHIRPPPEVPLIEGAALPDMLRRLAQFILSAALAPQALALYRLVHAEAARFPQLARAVQSDAGNREAVTLIGNLLARELPDSKLAAEDREFAAAQFIFMVMTIPRRRAIGYGTPMTVAELDTWTGKVVRLFLDGCRGMKG
jgi:TetR/AcrR family transcriptional regulator, mexJK operon transcriptional repressor